MSQDMLARLRAHRRSIALSFALTLTAVAAVASAKLARTGAAETTFKASGPAGMSIVGTSKDTSIVDDGTTVTITVNLANLSTGIDLRDRHTKEALETDKYPTTTLSVARSALKFPGDGGTTSGDTTGTMTLHGSKKNVSFHYDAKRSGATIDVTGSTRVNMSDFSMKPPSYLGVSVKDAVDVTTHFGATDG